MTPSLHEDLATSIDATLRAEARRNELAIAWVRALALVGLSLTDLYYTLEDSGVPWTTRVPTWTYAVGSLGLLALLRRGWHHRRLPVVVPLLDGLFILVRAQQTYSFHPLEVLERSMELATVVAGSALLIASGGFRLSRSVLAITTAVGVALYAWFAAQTRLEPAQAAVHLVLLGGLAVSTGMLTRQVRRAVRGEVARVTLARFLPATLLDGAHSDPIALVTRPRAVQATVLVSDIRGFTRWAEHRDPIDVLAALNVIQGRLATIVREHHGMVDKFMGDGMLAVFGTPEARPDHAELAVRAALRMLEAVDELSRDGRIDFRIGIGVHSGPLVVGCLGSGLRMEFTVLGDTVNIASRLEASTKEFGVGLLVSDETVSALPSASPLEPLPDGVTLRGRDGPLRAWRYSSSAIAAAGASESADSSRT